MCKRVQAKKGEVLTTPEMLEECKMKPRHRKKKQKQKNPKNYQRNVIKIQVNKMNVKDNEEQEGMEVSEKAGG